jgi:phenylacetate-CoA ligase
MFKTGVEAIPYQYSKHLVNIPWELRLGKTYKAQKKLIYDMNQWSDTEIIEWQTAKLKSLLRWSYGNIPFYKNLYDKYGYNFENFLDMRDWKDIPIVSKSMLQEYNLSHRASNNIYRKKFNTGGTSGQPLEFYLNRNAFANEWAHMHHIWEARGYLKADIKLTLRGKTFSNDRQCIKYNAVHNEFVANANCSMKEIVESVCKLSEHINIRWVHGYPSLVSEFSHALAALENSGSVRFKSGLKGVLLGSEFPAKIYRDAICRYLSKNLVCWYGHSEMCVLAYEYSENIYEALPSYGYAEALEIDGETTKSLLVTSFYNKEHPFIRYNTDDKISEIENADTRFTFSISGGRTGEFVEDAVGQKHSLTAIIFGRHHAAFELIKHVQLKQLSKGTIEVILVPRSQSTTIDELEKGFNFSGLNIQFLFKLQNEPIRTIAGKILLKIK